jgi:hypothetical protein
MGKRKVSQKVTVEDCSQGYNARLPVAAQLTQHAVLLLLLLLLLYFFSACGASE